MVTGSSFGKHNCRSKRIDTLESVEGKEWREVPEREQGGGEMETASTPKKEN